MRETACQVPGAVWGRKSGADGTDEDETWTQKIDRWIVWELEGRAVEGG